MINPGKEAIRKATFYTLFTGGGLLLANEIAKIPGVTQQLSGLENAVVSAAQQYSHVSHAISSAFVHGAELAAGLGVAYATGWVIKKMRKRSDFNAHMDKKNPKKQTPTQYNQGQEISQTQASSTLAGRLFSAAGSTIGSAVPATISGGLILSSYHFIPEMGNVAASIVQHGASLVSEQAGQLYTNYIGSGAAEAVRAITRSSLALCMIGTGTALRSHFSSTKHGPTLVSYSIDGYTKPMRELGSGQNLRLKLQRFARWIFRSTTLNTLSDDDFITAAVKVTDFRDRSKESDFSIGYKASFDPVPYSGRPLSQEDAKMVKNILCDGLEGKPLYGKDVGARARAVGLYAVLSASYKQAKDFPAQSSVDAFLTALSLSAPSLSPDQDISTISESEIAKRHQTVLEQESGRKFFRVFYEYDQGTPMVSVILSEDIGGTSAESKKEYGPEFARRGVWNPLLTFRVMRGSSISDQSAEDSGHHSDSLDHHAGSSDAVAGHDHYTTAYQYNFIRGFPKGLPQVATMGLGDAYSMNVNKLNFIYDDSWLRSGGPLGNLRRIGYISHDGRIVAKIVETSILSKLAGNYDSRIDIYDERLANDPAFGQVMSLFSQFLTHESMYRDHRLKNVQAPVPPTSPHLG